MYLKKSSRITFNTHPPGLVIQIDGVSRQTPYSALFPEDAVTIISAESQESDGVKYELINWGADDHPFPELLVSATDEEYTAVFKINVEESPDQFVTFPVPIRSSLSIVFIVEKPQVVHFTLLIVTGQEMIREDFEASEGRNSLSLDCSDLKDGLYFLRIKNRHLHKVKKLIIQR
jgi:hypothetical protein